MSSFWMSSLHFCEVINLPEVPICGALLQQPEETNTDTQLPTDWQALLTLSLSFSSFFISDVEEDTLPCLREVPS